ncbi:TonB-dependent receptor [Pedobacter sp.]|uniref:SusC/RagA family TonB-linked outer membrane protein n=1 Tax=Pedobacter sp. TaxID=1411316 RepID=UPI00280B5332|nr:TonB-dependent receptor [Pedobacter sp.]
MALTPLTQANAAKKNVAATKGRFEGHSNSRTNFVAIRVTGKVVDEKGLPMPGVSVRLKGSDLVVITNGDGVFNISVPDKTAVLVFSYTGFTSQEVTVGEKTQLNIIIKEQSSDLNSVIIVGYGTQKKKEQTAAISTLSGKDIVKTPVADITNSLIGQVPGIISRQASGKPGETASTIYVRGRASANSAALIIVDGIERETFGNIDANEIESISVLKDASSTALFGIKGANGVILVTTKSGNLGKTTISYSGGMGLTSTTGYPEVLEAFQSASLHNEGEDNLIRNGLLDINAKFFTANDLETFRRGDGDPLLYPNVNWYEAITRPNWMRTQHNLNFSGGSNRVKYFVSAGYLFEDGMFKNYETPSGYKTNADFNRYNFRSNLDFTLTKTTKVSLRLAGRLEQKLGMRGFFGGIRPGGTEEFFARIIALPSWGLPFFPEYTNPQTPEQRILDDTYNHITDFGRLGLNTPNPYAMLTRAGYFESDNNAFESIFVFDQALDAVTKGLSFKVTFGYDANILSLRTQEGRYSEYELNKTNSTLTLKPGTYDDELAAIQVSRDGYLKSNLQAGLNYNRVFGKHSVSVITVAQRELRRIAGANAPYANQGVVLSTKYNYNNKYYVEANGSYNGSENYPKGERYGLFPAVSAGWTISEESFMDNVKWLDFLKIRGSYGLIGFGGVGGRFLYLDAYTNGGASPGNLGGNTKPNTQVYFGNPNSAVLNPVVFHSQFGNPNVTWEKSIKRNLGFELQAFKNKLSLTFDVFDEKRYDILLGRVNSTSAIYGETLPQVNFGENKNQGFDFEINYKNNIGDFGYGINSTFTKAKNKYVIVDEAAQLPAHQKLAGTSIGQFIGYKVIGFYQDQNDINSSPVNNATANPVIPGDLKYMDVNGDGIIDRNDRVPVGGTDIPEIVYGFSPSFSYKNFAVSVLFQGVGKVSSNVREIGGGRLNYFAPQLGRWQSPADNETATWPVMKPNSLTGNPSYELNSFLLRDASYLKLRNIEISYQFPVALAKKMRVQNFRIFANGQNLHTWTNFPGLDPEISANTNYPLTRVFNFGLNVQF